ncbi:class I SAM-dependent methyltransferase [Embleya sp. NBC_00896]|uniref:class I SAM-dependent methyltransferase n=1 Tax=Embleya sp. NBC_00896 TaxID=2975961 RepID=UPI002F90865E|nr:class I SAM-dependent methyltransferase [Embleya sp. NBC_00896]
MSFDHNDHYHRLLLRQVPRGARTALDVGCGTGRFARRLASGGGTGPGLLVDAIDPSEEAVAAARAGSLGDDAAPRFRQADVTQVELPPGHYDFVSCLASLHHMPFDTVTSLRDALAPGGVLVVLGCAPERTWVDWAWSLAAVPTNAIARLAVAAGETARGTRTAHHTAVKAPVAPPTMPLNDIRHQATTLLPGSTVRRLLFWRYLLVYRNPHSPSPSAT